jgi:signal peptidase I
VALVGVVVNPAWAHLVRTTFAQAFVLPTGSMETTILRGEHCLAVKWVYGWRLPVLQGVVFGARPPRRGDLAVFPFPEDPSRSFLKRVVGLPGEIVEVREKVVFVDGKALKEPYARFMEPGSFARPDAELDVRVRDNWGPMKLPEEMYFVLGDNRDNSRDSRHWGFVREGDFLGRARVVYWSWDRDAARVRWERLGHRLE